MSVHSWRSFADDPPDDSQSVVIYAERSRIRPPTTWSVGLIYRNVSKGWNRTEWPFDGVLPSHWMPLPSPPDG